MKIISLVGARPQFIKEAAVQPKFLERGIEEVLVNSGQHYDRILSDVFFDHLKIHSPKYNLNIGSASHAVMTAEIMRSFEEVVSKEKPDMVVVYGDTNTTAAGALVARKMKIDVAHVEAGLRMSPNDMPEEINRVMTDHLSTMHFAPSKLCVDNLRRENISNNVYLTGDVMYDLYLKLEPQFNKKFPKKLGLEANKYILCTLHRDFNVDNKRTLRIILSQLNKLANDYQIVLPIHPRTKKRINSFKLDGLLNNVKVIEPVGYFEIMGLLQNCAFVLTDSGGLQKEAYFAKKRAIVIMEDTAWRELIELGWNILSEPADIQSKVDKILQVMEMENNLYGDGKSSEKIARALLK